MIVLKFGGTSLGSADAIRRVGEIVAAARPRRPALVVSAHAGVTNALLDLAERAPNGDVDFDAIVERHRTILTELDLDPTLHDARWGELGDLVRGMKLVGEASPRARDYLLSFGERCSARTVAAHLAARGIAARAVDAWEAGLRTDGPFGNARPRADGDGRVRAALAEREDVPVVTGFVGMDDAGNVTTLGRNGSDLSAAWFGQALGAEEIQIWTDVDGVMTADPTLVPDAQRIDEMSFDEASELAYYGGRVLHPATLVPAIDGGIPVRVLNTHRRESPGTMIRPTPEAAGGPAVRSIVYKEGIHLVSLVTPRMLQQPGYLGRVFGLCAEHEVDIDLVATSEVSITMTTDRGDRLPGLVRDLSALGEVTVEAAQALVCVVGHGIAHTPGIAATVLATLGDAGVRVRVISQGAIKVNVALVVAEASIATAVRALHARFFGARAATEA